MDKFIIKGGTRLEGSIKISGSKNCSLALMASVLLAPGKYKIINTPDLRDVSTMSLLLENMGAKVDFSQNLLTIDTTGVNSYEAPYEHVKKMRASFYVLGPLLARFGRAKVSLPGGCAWGPRPVDLHIKAMQKLGAIISIEKGYVIAKTKKLKGNLIHFDISSVGATGNALMAATLAKGTTVITNAAIEPEITALAEMLVKMGAKIDGIGTTTLTIEGVDELYSCDFENIPDRIESATFLIAAAMTKGKIELNNTNYEHMTAVLTKLEESGCKISYDKKNIYLEMENSPIPTDIITSVYPGIPTDIQAQWTAYMLLAKGTSKITDTIYYDRFKHIPELMRLGADIDLVENTAIVNGGKQLSGAVVMSSDLRGSASLILAGLVAKGTTEVLRIYHIDRGYEKIENKLNSIGANIKRVKTDII